MCPLRENFGLESKHLRTICARSRLQREIVNPPFSTVARRGGGRASGRAFPFFGWRAALRGDLSAVSELYQLGMDEAVCHCTGMAVSQELRPHMYRYVNQVCTASHLKHPLRKESGEGRHGEIHRSQAWGPLIFHAASSTAPVCRNLCERVWHRYDDCDWP